jgi:choline-sulfatase
MRILYLDIDSLRPDHLGCYGYPRDTSPNLDRIAAAGVRYTACHASDAPCMPSRSALFSGQFGFHTGVINHGGVAAQPFIEGPGREFRDRFGSSSWPVLFRRLGYHTASISSFGERHSAWHWHAGFHEVINNGLGGNENADRPCDDAIRWLDHHGRADNWFLHLNVWDPHTPYRVPADFGHPFADSPAPAWLTEEIRQHHWRSSGSHGAQEIYGYSDEIPSYLRHLDLSRQPARADSMAAVKAMFDGYDTGIRYADHHIGRVLAHLASLGLLDDTAIIVSSDHGENLGELNVYGDHQTADYLTTRLPLLIKWPGVTDQQAGRVDHGLCYHVDFAATVAELAGAEIPADWDGRSFAAALRAGREDGRDHLVVSQAAWCCQRAVRTRDHLYIRTYHDAWHDYPEEMLFNLTTDPHELHDLAPSAPAELHRGRALLAAWREEMLRRSRIGIDPMNTVLDEGGSLHAREGGGYLDRLRATGRADVAERLARKHAVRARAATT